MSDKFKGLYRGETFRLQNWDYSSEGLYFITICTQNREHFFGEIENGIIKLSEIGELANKYWCEIENQFSFITLGEFIVMPNHIHGILEINKSVVICKEAINRVPTNNNNATNQIIENNTRQENESFKSNDTIGGFSGHKNPMVNDNVSRVIRWYKGRCTFEMRKINSDFKWQSLFHDHIIRNQKSFEKIQHYIINNPKKWNIDVFNK